MSSSSRRRSCIGCGGFYVYYIRAPIALYRKSSTPRDTTRTLDPAYPEPIDDEVLHYLEAHESRLLAMGFCDPHRTTSLTTYPLTLVGVVHGAPRAR